MFRDIKNDPNSVTREIKNKALIIFSHNILKKNCFIDKKIQKSRIIQKDYYSAQKYKKNVVKM